MIRRLACAWLFVVLAGQGSAAAERTLTELQVWRVKGGLTVIQFNEVQIAQLGMSLVRVEESARVPPFEHMHIDTPYVAFAIDPESTLEFTITDGIFIGYENQEQTIRHRGGFTLLFRTPGGGPRNRVDFRDFVIGPANITADALFDLNNDCLYLRESAPSAPLQGSGAQGRFAFNLRGPMRAFMDLSSVSPYAKTSTVPYLPLFWTTDDGMSLLWVGQADLLITENAAAAVARPQLAGIPIGMIEVYAIADLVGDRPPTDAEAAAILKAYPRVPFQSPPDPPRKAPAAETSGSDGRERVPSEAARTHP